MYHKNTQNSSRPLYIQQIINLQLMTQNQSLANEYNEIQTHRNEQLYTQTHTKLTYTIKIKQQ